MFVNSAQSSIVENINVLVFPCGSEAALELHTSLSQTVNIKLFGASSRDDHGRFVYKNYISGVPYIQDQDFIPAFNAVLEENDIHFVIPIHDTVTEYLSENREKLRCRLVLGDKETCKVCRDKKLTYILFQDAPFCPVVYPAMNAVDHFPVFLKPTKGQGGQLTQRVENMEELEFYLTKTPDLLILEYLPGKELTIDCFTNRHGQLMFMGPRTRDRVRDGISVRSTSIPVSDVIRDIGETINAKLGFRGLWFFQLRQDRAGNYKLLEVSTRTAGTMNLYRCTGVNFALLSVYDALDRDVKIIKNDYNIQVDRALVNRYEIDHEYRTVYIDFDDTIIVRNEVNSLMIMYLYQLVNKGKHIVLLTRHARGLDESLRKYRIDKSLFDDIVLLDDIEEKSDYINDTNSIFIDNAFAEREKVFTRNRIPVFDVDSVYALLDWRL